MYRNNPYNQNGYIMLIGRSKKGLQMKIFPHFSISIGWLFEQSWNLSKKKLAPAICSYVVHFKLKNGFFSLGCKPLSYDQQASKKCLNVRIGKIEKGSRMLFWQTLFELCFNN